MNRSLAQKGAVAASKIDLCRRVQVHDTTRGCIRVEGKGNWKLLHKFRVQGVGLQGNGPNTPEVDPVMRT